jgi:hypothetical protein
MKKKLKLTRKTIKNLKLKLKKVSDRKAAPLFVYADDPSNGESC